MLDDKKHKFRVWSFLDKCFHYFDLHEGVPQGIAGGISEPQQYIGLKDRNGNCIYEGDIIQEHRYEDWGDKIGFKYIGIIKHAICKTECGQQFSGYGSFTKHSNEIKNFSGNRIQENCEIVGNIFTRPNLIK